MEQLTDLKAILHSKRANIYYIEMCRVMQKEGRVVYLSENKKDFSYWNIPIANTTCLLLGTGTSITQAAMRMLSQAGVIVGFCGGGATPLLSGVEIEWLTPQSEYRPTEYLQRWVGFWFDENKRLEAAKHFQRNRLEYIRKVWQSDHELQSEGFVYEEIASKIGAFKERIEKAQSVGKLLQLEAELTKKLYKYAARCIGMGEFTRDRESVDEANAFLNHGNYLAYGMAASALWVLGIPHALAVMHGKTRRGALVFDVADLIKDAIVLPWAFVAAKEGFDEQGFRTQCLQSFIDHRVMERMIDEITAIAEKIGEKP